MAFFFYHDAAIGEVLGLGKRNALGKEANEIAVDGDAFYETGESQRGLAGFRVLNPI